MYYTIKETQVLSNFILAIATCVAKDSRRTALDVTLGTAEISGFCWASTYLHTKFIIESLHYSFLIVERDTFSMTVTS